MIGNGLWFPKVTTNWQ